MSDENYKLEREFREKNKDFFMEKEDRIADLKYLMSKFDLNLDDARRM